MVGEAVSDSNYGYTIITDLKTIEKKSSYDFIVKNEGCINFEQIFPDYDRQKHSFKMNLLIKKPSAEDKTDAVSGGCDWIIAATKVIDCDIANIQE